MEYTEPKLVVVDITNQDVVRTSNGDNSGTYVPGKANDIVE